MAGNANLSNARAGDILQNYKKDLENSKSSD